jgi:glucosamine-6-phosphate deaminase
MEVVILPGPEAVATAGAEVVARLVRAKPAAVLALPTGATARPVYAELVRRHRDEGLSFARATTFNLDEYVGVPPDHVGSFRRYMQDAFFSHVDLPPERAHVPDGFARDVAAACADYESAIAASGGLDLVLLGLGEDGHIAFNEPTSSFASRTRLKTLSAASRAANQAAFGTEPVPGHVITMGIATILGARRCVLLAHGARKAAAFAAMVEGPLTSMLPASALQLHGNAIVIADEAAAAGLANADYYRQVQASKPEWQR